MESTSFTIDVRAVIASAVIFALSASIVLGGIIGHRRSRNTVERTLAAVATADGVAILTTLLLGGFELIAPVWPLLFLELGLFGMLFWVWMLIDCAVNEPSTGNDKLVWVIIILFTHVLGAVIYLLVRRPRRADNGAR